MLRTNRALFLVCASGVWLAGTISSAWSAESAPAVSIRFVDDDLNRVSELLSQQDMQAQQRSRARTYRIVRDGKELPVDIKQQLEVDLATRFDPLLATKESRLRAPIYDQQRQQFVVQFHTQIIPSYRQLVSSLGLEILGTQSKQVLRIRGTGAQATALSTNPVVRWLGKILSADKLKLMQQSEPSSIVSQGLGSEARNSGTQQAKLNVLLAALSESEHAQFAEAVSQLGGRIVSQHAASTFVIVEVPSDRIEELANSVTVEQIEYWTPPETDMNNIRAITGSDYAEAQPPILVSGVPGFTGAGVRGEIMDGPWVRTSHNDFNPEPIPHNASPFATSSHATAVYGIVFGDGSSNASARGQIPDGTGIFSSYFDISNSERAAHTAELLDPFRAVFQTNSWGDSRTFNYNSTSRSFDTMLFDNDVLVLQSQSNAGNQDSRPQAWAKNVLSIGGVRHQDNQNLGDDYWCTTSHATTCSYNGAASIGPADDGRIKPDLSNAYDDTLTTDDDFDSDYRQFGGTSGATPITAGTAGIMFQMWAEGVLNGSPSPTGSPDDYVFDNRPKVATAKALLINTARQYPITSGGGQNIPRNIQGWGVANAQDMFVAAHNHGGAFPLIVDEYDVLENGDINSYTINVAGTTTNPTNRWMKATLVYKDPAAVGNPAQELVNDISLRLTSPSGAIYWGNVGVSSANWSTPGGSDDTINNVENVFIELAEEGVWQVDVLGTDIGTDAHSDPTDAINAVYSLVVSCGGSNLCEDSTLPVMLSHFKAKPRGRKIRFDWLTATETFNIGFNLWGQVSGQWQQLNKHLIASKGVNSIQAQRYKRRVRIDDLPDEVSAVGISSVDTSGREEFYGPFALGQEYGSDFIPDKVDWQIVRDEHRRKMKELGYELIRDRWRKPKNQKPNDKGSVEFEIRKAGMYRVTYEDLLAAGVDWKNVAARNIALSYKGEGVPRYVYASKVNNRKRQKFGPESFIDFYVAPPRGDDALYTKTAIYKLSVARDKALNAAILNASALEESDPANDWFYRSYSLGEDKLYTLYAVNNDPWVDASLFSRGSPVSKEYVFEHEVEPAAGQTSRLNVSLMGGVNFPGDPFETPDHHVRIYLNDHASPIFDDFKDGAVEWDINLTIDNSLLNSEQNTVTIEVLADNAFGADIVNVRELNLELATPAVHDEEPIIFKADDALDLSGLNRDDVAYAFDDDLNLSKINLVEQSSTLPKMADAATKYWVSGVDKLLTPKDLRRIDPEAHQALPTANYLIIVHPQFNTPKLTDYVEHRRAQGHLIHVESVLDIYSSYASGMPIASAIDKYIEDFAAVNALTHVLLVGGSSYDYHDNLGFGSLSFIPTTYSKSRGFGFHQPSDNPYSDLDGDHLPDLAIGRWPVRTQAQLNNIIDKTLAFEQQGGLGQAQSALLIADSDSQNAIQSYREQVEALSKYLVDANGEQWQDLTRVYLEPDGGVAEATQKIIDTISDGVSLTIYDGHASPAQWSFRNLFNQRNASQFADTQHGTQVLSLACYTTYFDEPHAETLAHQLLFASTGGAVALNGSVSLGRFKDNELLATHITDNQLSKGQDLGTAILNAKRRVGLSKLDAIVQWALLGDPTLRMSN